MPTLNTHDIDSLTGATYFVVGRGTEGGQHPYRLAIAGVTDTHWGQLDKVAANSGYSLGTIQVDLGQRGTWALGATDGAALKVGETTYVDGIINQAAKYAKAHDLTFTSDTAQLRTDLLTHGDGDHGHTSLKFIDTDTRDSINAWASSEDGQKWIHKNIDYPQVRHATQSAVDLLDRYGENIPEDHRLETIAILAKTQNQIPAQMTKFETVLKNGGDYNDVLAEANEIKRHHRFYDGPKAGALAEQYANAYADSEKAAALDRAHVKVCDANFDPLKWASDPDIQEALKVVGQAGRANFSDEHGSLRLHSHGEKVMALQTDLAKLGFTDRHGHALHPDGDFGAETKAAVKTFQHTHHLKPDGVAGTKTLDLLQKAAHPPQPTLADATHSGNAMYLQSRDAVYRLDAEQGRVPDQRSDNLAGMLAVAAHANGMTRIDHVVLSDDAARAYAVQGEMHSVFKRYTDVNVSQAVITPLAQSSAQWLQTATQLAPATPLLQQAQNPQMEPPALRQ
ncbi:MAG: peptidoglycan-binding domain-containing protein [Casimicrobiaceae bacterium]